MGILYFYWIDHEIMSPKNLFHLNRSCNSFPTIFGVFLHYGIPKIIRKMKFKQIRPLGLNAAHGRTAPLDPALLRPAKPAHSKTEPGPTRPSFYGCFGPPGETGEGIAPPPPPPRRWWLTDEIRPANGRGRRRNCRGTGPRGGGTEFGLLHGGRLNCVGSRRW
jgi:hypothetical protein